MNIGLVRLPSRQWPKVSRGAAKYQIKNTNDFFGENVILKFLGKEWPKNGSKLAQHELFQALSKLYTSNLSDFLHEVTEASRLEIKTK